MIFENFHSTFLSTHSSEEPDLELACGCDTDVAVLSSKLTLNVGLPACPAKNSPTVLPRRSVVSEFNL